MSNKVQAFEHTFQDGAEATGNGTAMDVGGLSVVGVQVEGITTATVTFEGTIDDSNWVAIEAKSFNDGAVATTVTADDLVAVPVAGLSQLRCRISAYTNGTITATGKGITAGYAVI